MNLPLMNSKVSLISKAVFIAGMYSHSRGIARSQKINLKEYNTGHIFKLVMPSSSRTMSYNSFFHGL